MEAAVFGLAMQRLGITQNGRGNRGYEAARMVMVEGMKVSQAARICKVTRQTIYKSMDNVEDAFSDLGICQSCGQKMPNV